MGNCPNCNRHSLFLRTTSCKVCGKETCDKCKRYLFKIWSPNGTILDKWYACSSDCEWTLADKVEKQITSLDTFKLENISPIIPQLVRDALLSNYWGRVSNEVKKKRTSFSINFAPLDELDYNPRGNVFWKRLYNLLQKRFEEIRMENWIKAGRFEDAAIFLEKQGKYEEAGKVRARNREIVVKKTEVKVDLNNLLKQVAKEGIVAVYRCPHCGGRLKIGKETKLTNLRVCEHCSSEIGTMDLADFLKTVLS